MRRADVELNVQRGVKGLSAMVSILIATRNEQKDLPDCLRSVAWSDDLHVYDSWSSDDTVRIAEGAGAKVTMAPHGPSNEIFGGDEAAHRNWALRNIQFKYPWVLLMDADERSTSALESEIKATLLRSSEFVGYRMGRRDILWGTWLKHVQVTAWYLRLFRPEAVHYERLINPILVASGPVGYLKAPFDHFPFSKGMAHWIDRHNAYSSLEALQIERNRKEKGQWSILRALFDRDISVRRFHQKELFYRLPARPIVKFVSLYVVKGGALDGVAGFWYSLLQSMYECMIVLKERELRKR